MELTLKVDDNQQAVLSEGKPVYILTDGDKEPEDFVADVPSMYLNTIKLKGEAKTLRTKSKESETSLGVFTTMFDGVDDVPEWKSNADKALETVKNLGDKELIEAGKVDEVKEELQTAHDKNLAGAKKKFDTALEEKDTKLAEDDLLIRRLTIGQHFATDPHFVATTGNERPKTSVQPSMAESHWGHLFTVDRKKSAADNKPLVVGHHPLTGDEILSTRPDTVGEIATFNEAIAVIIENSPEKASILNTGGAGSGAGGGGGGGGGGGSDELSQLEAQYKTAVEAGDGRAAVGLKNRIFSIKQGLAKQTGT